MVLGVLGQRLVLVFACQLTGIPHSCGDAQFGQQIDLQKDPTHNDTDKYQNFYHIQILIYFVRRRVKSISYFFIL